MEKNITAGLVKGRHEMPVESYIWDGPVDPMDMKGIRQHAFDWVAEHCNIRRSCGQGLNQEEYTDVQVSVGDPLEVYVTGLTACTAAVITACACNGVPLTLMHYNAANGSYVAQPLF